MLCLPTCYTTSEFHQLYLTKWMWMMPIIWSKIEINHNKRVFELFFALFVLVSFDIHTPKQQNDPHITTVNIKLTAGQYNCQLYDTIKVRSCVHYVWCRQTSIEQLTFFNRKYCLLSSSVLNDLNTNSYRWLKYRECI